MPQLKKKEVQSEIGLKMVAYLGIRDKIKELEKQKETLRNDIASYLEGRTVADGGVKEVVANHAGVEVKASLTKIRKFSFAEDAIDILKEELSTQMFSSIVKTKKETYIDEKVLEAFYNKGKISDDIISKLYVELPSTQRVDVTHLKEV